MICSESGGLGISTVLDGDCGAPVWHYTGALVGIIRGELNGKIIAVPREGVLSFIQKIVHPNNLHF